MSRERQTSRAQRAAAASARADAERRERDRLDARKARRERRTMAWRRARLWQHGPGFRRHREQWGALATLVLLALLVVYIFTRSLSALFGTALICVIAAPVLALLFFDRSR